MRRRVFILTLSAWILISAGCQQSPEKPVVVNKNNGSFQSALNETQSADQTTLPTHYTADFSSTDGSIHFRMDLDTNGYGCTMPVVEVIPHTVTSEDMERVARVLLGDVDFYEREPSSNPQYSQSQYREMINRWTPYASIEAATELMGQDRADSWLINLRHCIDSATTAMETAPKDNPLTPCDWTLKKERHYNDRQSDIAGRPLSADEDWLVVTAEKDGVGYKYMVSVREQEDYKKNWFFIQLGGGSLDVHLDRQIFWARLCRTKKPTQEQIRGAEEKALDLLNRMGLGDWEIAYTQVDVYGAEDTVPEYMLYIYAAPSFCGHSAMYDQVETQRYDHDYAGSYRLTYANFIMSANGDLIQMALESPMDIKTVVNEQVATLSFEEMMERAQQQLSLADRYEYLLRACSLQFMTADDVDDYEQRHGESLICTVNIAEMEYGLARVPVQDSLDSYYYVPAVLLSGAVELIGAESGEVYLTGNKQLTLCINAIDGSVIE